MSCWEGKRVFWLVFCLTVGLSLGGVIVGVVLAFLPSALHHLMTELLSHMELATDRFFRDRVEAAWHRGWNLIEGIGL